MSPGSIPCNPSGKTSLTLSSDWLDATGYFTLSGFRSVKLFAAHDITLTDHQYNTGWKGELLTSAGLTLLADRIYPTTLSDFTINSSGDIDIGGSSSPHNSSPIYSAGGNLTIVAKNIDMEGCEIAAPMGQITLQADQNSGSVYLAAGSVLSTSGSIPVSYGSLDSTGVFWTTTDKTDLSDSLGICGIQLAAKIYYHFRQRSDYGIGIEDQRLRGRQHFRLPVPGGYPGLHRPFPD